MLFAVRGLQWPGLTPFFNLWVEHNEDCSAQSSKSEPILKLTLQKALTVVHFRMVFRVPEDI